MKTKFRAWDKTDKRMITHEQDFIPLKVTSMGVLRLNPHHKESLWEVMPEDRFELMQFTGLLDKNHNEIFEGDIIETPEGIFIIEFQSGCFFAKSKNRFLEYHNILYNSNIIIGNQFENPELLK